MDKVIDALIALSFSALLFSWVMGHALMGALCAS